MPDLFGWSNTPASPAAKASLAVQPAPVTRERAAQELPPGIPENANRPAPCFGPDSGLRQLDAFASAEDLADPVFCAIYDVVRPWSVWVPERGQAGASFCMSWHVHRIARALRERGLVRATDG